MKDPLTKTEIRKMKKNFLQIFDEVYKSVLASGAIPDHYGLEHNHLPARMALVLAAEKYAPLTHNKKDFANLRLFV